MQHRIAVLLARKNPLTAEKAALAERIGVTPATLGRLMRGEVVMQIETMFFFAREANHEIRLDQPQVTGFEEERAGLDAAEGLLRRARFDLAKREIDEKKRQQRLGRQR